MQYLSVISYPAYVPCPGALPYSDLFNHVCDLCVLNILISIFVCAAASLFCAWVVSAHVSAPYVIAGSTNEL